MCFFVNTLVISLEESIHTQVLQYESNIHVKYVAMQLISITLIWIYQSNINVKPFCFNAAMLLISTKTEWQWIGLGHSAGPAGRPARGHHEGRLEVQVDLVLPLVAGQPHCLGQPCGHHIARGRSHLSLHKMAARPQITNFRFFFFFSPSFFCFHFYFHFTLFKFSFFATNVTTQNTKNKMKNKKN